MHLFQNYNKIIKNKQKCNKSSTHYINISN